jgi:antirestriction protein ArdC
MWSSATGFHLMRMRRRFPGRTEVLSHVDAVVAATGADIRIGGEMAFYSPSTTSFRFPPQQAYFEPINWYRTVLHEAGHWAGGPFASQPRFLWPTW